MEKRSRPGYGWMVVGMALALAIAYVLGTVQFMLVNKMPLPAALTVAVFPFLPLDLLKMFVAAGLAVKVRQVLGAAGYLETAAKGDR